MSDGSLGEAVVQRSRGRWWVNKPWYTDWALWTGAAAWFVWAVAVVIPAAGWWGLTGSFGGDAVVAFVVLLGAAEWAVLLVLARGVCRAIFRVPKGRLGLPTEFRVAFKGSGVVTYRRDRDGNTVEQIHRVPPSQRAAALRLARPRAAAAGFVVDIAQEQPRLPV